MTHKQFEYKIIDAIGGYHESVECTLNDLGKYGWELVSCTNHLCYLKREKN